MDWAALLLGAAGGLITAGTTAYIAWRRLRPDINKTNAETAELIGQAWQELLTPLREEIAVLRDKVIYLECEIGKRDIEVNRMKEQRVRDQKRIRELESEVAILKSQLEDLGHKPETNNLGGAM